ncbi:hypothetical protein GLOIN_2v1701366 [Rhizophagus clarus]|uniref:Uncharacterized protein n=1 Tax=Rhizophagus clarus TaxID=94130 RepID=A0A8H3M9T8_9GLOM|nr:hypothetical protein GLOIN_2v1701366 [Rhizophagus clarus]
MVQNKIFVIFFMILLVISVQSQFNSTQLNSTQHNASQFSATRLFRGTREDARKGEDAGSVINQKRRLFEHKRGSYKKKREFKNE